MNPPPGHIIDDQGVTRKVLGTLPITEDGCVVGHGGAIHTILHDHEGSHYGIFQSSVTECDDFSAESFDGYNWFSTREAAEAAEAAASRTTEGGEAA